MSFAATVAAAAGIARKAAGETITLTRASAAGPTAGVVASRGKTSGETPEAFGRPVRVDAIDFLIAATDYAFDGTITYPDRGDTITDAAGNVYDVRSPGASVPEWEWSDPGRTQLRVHTKLKTRASAGASAGGSP
ncbi:MAG: hypothetical protein AAF078_01880 [Planctomycetota bacterium]